jgi:hypothetical protein
MLKGWTRIAVLTAFAFIAAFLLHWLMEWAVHSYVVGIEIFEGFLAALIAGILVFYICLVEHWRHLKYQRRLQAVARLNHHVRNALQALMGFTDGHLGTPATDLQRAIARIDWVLRDVEPHLMQPETESPLTPLRQTYWRTEPDRQN